MINHITDAQELIPTSEFKWAKFPFEKFNPVQSSLYSFVDKNCNGLVAASTSAGKTVVSEMFGSFAIRQLKKKFIFLCPLRALANEKYQDWTAEKHHFSDLKISILTGDYKGDLEQLNFDDSDVIIMTSEMLNHKLRVSSKNKKWIDECGVIVVDESHLLTVEGRGDHLESALMNITKINPATRIILLSATMPNVDDIAKWMGYILNGKETFILRSTYRPCKLNIHSCVYDDESAIRAPYLELIDEGCKVIQRFINDKFLVFVHTKKMGELVIQELMRRGIKSEFHNANLDKTQRANLENAFKNDKNMRVIVATSTLAWGVNLPARRVVIMGISRGNEIVASYDILQMVGRAGRPAFDPEGDAYVFFPNSKRRELQKIVLTPQEIHSRMLDLSNAGDYEKLAFHILYEVYSGTIKTIQDAEVWFSRTLAFFQNKKLKKDILEITFEKLCNTGILLKDDVTGDFVLTGLGKVSVFFYAEPLQIASWARNFSVLFKKPTIDDVEVCLALSNTSKNLIGSLNKDDKYAMSSFLKKVKSVAKKDYPENILKTAYLYNKVLYGQYDAKYASIMKNMQQDFPRIVAVLHAIDSMSKKWNKKDFFRLLGKRMQHGVPARLVEIIDIKGVGKIKAEKLYENGFTDKNKIMENINEAARIAGIRAETLLNNLKS